MLLQSERKTVPRKILPCCLQERFKTTWKYNSNGERMAAKLGVSLMLVCVPNYFIISPYCALGRVRGSWIEAFASH